MLADELRGLKLDEVKDGRAGASFTGNLEDAYRVCLWSRLANRVLLKLASFPAATPEALYEGIGAIDWAEHMSPEASLAVDFAASRSQHHPYPIRGAKGQGCHRRPVPRTVRRPPFGAAGSARYQGECLSGQRHRQRWPGYFRREPAQTWLPLGRRGRPAQGKPGCGHFVAGRLGHRWRRRAANWSTPCVAREPC